MMCNNDISAYESMDQHLKTCKCDNSVFPINMRKQLNLLGDNAGDGWWDWHLLENFEYMSPRFWEILGYDPNEMKHHPSEWQKLILPDDLIKATNSFKLHINSHGSIPFQEEVRYKHASGKIIWVVCKGKVVEWDGDTAIRIVGAHTDITERKQLEKYFKDFKSIFYNGITPCTIKNISGEYLEVNKKFCELTGYTEDELVGKNFSILTIDEEKESDLIRIAELTSNNSMQSFEKRIITKNNKIIWCNVMQTAIEYGDRRVIYAQISNIDKKKEMAEKAREFSDYLAKKKDLQD